MRSTLVISLAISLATSTLISGFDLFVDLTFSGTSLDSKMAVLSAIRSLELVSLDPVLEATLAALNSVEAIFVAF